MKKIYSGLASILGFVIIILYALKNATTLFDFSFEGMDDILGYFNLAQQYLVYALAGLVGLELVAGKKIIAFIFFLLLAFVVITTFFPDIANSYLPS
jgi:hypothetical protein